MAGSTQVAREYPFSDFPNAKVNTAILAAEVAASDPAISQTLSSASTSGTTLTFYFDALIDSDDETQLDALVAAHLGDDFESPYQRASTEAESSNDTTTDETYVTLNTGPLPAGHYSISWYAEIKADAIVTNTGALVRFVATKNSGTEQDVGQTINDLSQYVSFSGSYTLEITDGDVLDLNLVYRRMGTTSNPAYIRRARIFLSPQGA